MTSTFVRPFIPLLCAAAALVGASNASAMPLTGVPTTDGWTFIGNSRNTSSIIYARSGPVNFDSYLTTFTLSAGDAFTGTGTGVQGSAVGALVSGGWLENDRIIGLGISATNDTAVELNTGFFKIDFGGTGTWASASSVGGTDGSASFSSGGVGSIIGSSIQSSPLGPWVPGAGNHSGGGGGTVLASAFRAWVVPKSSNTIAFTDMQWLVNYDELGRQGIAVAAFGAQSKFAVGASGQVPGADAGVNRGEDVVFSRALTFDTAVTSVPEPGTLALFALGLIGAGIARRRA